MKVVLLAPTPPPAGGIASWTQRMQKVKLKNEWKVEVVDEKILGTREVFGKSKMNLAKETIRILNIWKNLLKKLMDKDVKIVHSCIPSSTNSMVREIVCAIITKMFKRKFIIHYRCTVPNLCIKKVDIMLLKVLNKLSDKIFVLNSESYNFVKSHSKTKLDIIPNFIENSIILNDSKVEISDKISNVIYTGGVTFEKGSYDILEIAKNFPEIRFNLVGKFEKDFIDSINTENVFLLGEKDKLEVQSELLKSDLFLFPTFYPGEGFSNSLLEAMAFGLPCIATDWAANKDMLEQHGGIIVQVNNVKQIINAIHNLNLDKEKREKQSKWNILKVEKYYSEEIIVNRYVDEYEKLISSKQGEI